MFKAGTTESPQFVMNRLETSGYSRQLLDKP